MNLSDITITKQPLVLAKPDEVTALEQRLWVTFPAGYREYVCQLGEGTLGGKWVRIYPPWRIANELEIWKKRIKKYWFWETGEAILPKDRAVECVIIGDTVNGDELVFHPTRSNRLFVLSRDSDNIFEAGNDLLSAVDWMCSSDKLISKFQERNFLPFDSRKVAPNTQSGNVVDPNGECIEDLIELGKEWTIRHDTKKAAKKALNDYLSSLSNIPNLKRDNWNETLLYEGILSDAEYPIKSGYFVVFRIAHNLSGLVLGEFYWNKVDSGSSCQFSPNNENIRKLFKTR